MAGGPAGGAIGAVLGIGLAIDSIARMLDRQTQGPPEGSNWTDYKSLMIGRTLAARLPETFNRAENPLQLLGIALSGSAMAPHAEIQITHDTWGSGGDFYDPVSPDLLISFVSSSAVCTSRRGRPEAPRRTGS